MELTKGERRQEPGHQHFLNIELRKLSGVNNLQIAHSTGDRPSLYQGTRYIEAFGHEAP